MKIEPDKEAIDAMFAAHEREQILFIARNTTFDQRIKQLEEMVNLARKIYIEREAKGVRTIVD